MDVIKGVFRNGQIIFSAPADWPEGTEVLIEPIGHPEMFGMREEEWPATPEAAAAWLAWYDALEPLELTAEEEADIAAENQELRRRQGCTAKRCK